MRHRSYPEFHIPATVVPDKDAQEFLDAAGSVARFPSSPPPSLAIGAYPGVTPGANLPEGLSLAPEPEALPLEEHLRQALRISHQSFRRCYYNRIYASSEYVFLALAKSHPELRDSDRLEVIKRISDAIGYPTAEIEPMSTVSRAKGMDYYYEDLDGLILRNWDAIEKSGQALIVETSKLIPSQIRKADAHDVNAANRAERLTDLERVLAQAESGDGPVIYPGKGPGLYSASLPDLPPLRPVARASKPDSVEDLEGVEAQER